MVPLPSPSAENIGEIRLCRAQIQLDVRLIRTQIEFRYDIWIQRLQHSLAVHPCQRHTRHRNTLLRKSAVKHGAVARVVSFGDGAVIRDGLVGLFDDVSAAIGRVLEVGGLALAPSPPANRSGLASQMT